MEANQPTSEPVVEKRGPGGARPGPMNGMFGKHHSEEHKQRLREQMLAHNPFKGKHHSEETRKRLSELRKLHPSPMKGRHHSEETKAKIAATKKGMTQHPNTILGVKRAQTGKPSHASGCIWSEASRAQLGASMKKLNASRSIEWWTDYKTRMSENSKGRVFSAEWKANLREARKGVILGSTPWSGKQFKQGKYASKKDAKEIVYQSSYELAAFELLELREDVISYDRCLHAIPYMLEDGLHHYIPDIQILWADGSETVVEVKPQCFLNDPVNLKKHEVAKVYFDEKGVDFEIWTEEELDI